MCRFLSTPSARRATTNKETIVSTEKFLSTPSARRATRQIIRRTIKRQNFYPRPPRGGRRLFAQICEHGIIISIHALREEGDRKVRRAKRQFRDFYPRPPRGGRQQARGVTEEYQVFLSTPSARRATGAAQCEEVLGCISIHALREEGDRTGIRIPGGMGNFYPRPPRGGRQASKSLTEKACLFLSTPSARRATGCYQGSLGNVRFLSTPSARRATAKTETKSLFSNKLYNILHEFRRALIYNGSKSYPNHAK